MYGGMKAFSPGHGDTAAMQSRSIGAAATAASMICCSAPGSAAIAAWRMHWTHSQGISFPIGCLKSLEYPRTGRAEVIAATTILSARSGLARTALPTIEQTVRGSALTMTELNAARNCSGDALSMVAFCAASARTNASLPRPCCIAISSWIRP